MKVRVKLIDPTWDAKVMCTLLAKLRIIRPQEEAQQDASMERIKDIDYYLDHILEDVARAKALRAQANVERKRRGNV